MKKKLKLLSFALFGAVFILCSGCTLSNKKNENMCESVNDYLSKADFDGKGQQVKKGDFISVDYIGRLSDGTVFDTNIESVAKGCDKYYQGREYVGLKFTVGAGEMISGFDKGVEGMKIGQTKTIEIAPADAYGERDETKIKAIEKSLLENPEQYTVGQTLYTEYGQAVKVSKITKDEIFLDTNHELAGQTLIFDITIREIK